jgi:predicted ATPase
MIHYARRSREDRFGVSCSRRSGSTTPAKPLVAATRQFPISWALAMAETIKKLTIEGFKSIRKLEEFELGPLNVLIGANGAGKTNFVSFFRLLRDLIQQRLQMAVALEGGADSCLFLGPKETPRLGAKFSFGQNGYEFYLVPAHDGRLIFSEETTVFSTHRSSLGSGQAEARLKDRKDDRGRLGGAKGVSHYVFDAISSWVVYHFHDTSFSAAVRRLHALNDNIALGENAENLAPFLYRISQSDRTHYLRIRDVVRLAAPFFDDFLLRPIPGNEGMIQLEWRQRDSDYPFRANQLSDGTLRFICLATALLQPDPPATMLFDEPELGLHPYALTLLGNLFRQAVKGAGNSDQKQIIISTQSAPLLNEFTPEDIIIVDRVESESIFRRLTTKELSEWLEDYTLGELWQKNVLGGRPANEHRPELIPKGVNGHS